MTSWNRNTKIPFWKKYLPHWVRRTISLVFSVCLSGLVAISALGFYYFLLASKFDLSEVAKLPEKAKFYDRNGLELEMSDSLGMKLASRQEIPDFLTKALIAREDARFFEHHGLDYLGLIRATLRNVKDREFTQGASTLTMQLARNTYKMRAKSLHRKALEIALTLRIEFRYTKDEILTSYLNRIYFGSGAYGIEQAAQTYFGKNTSQLLESESAMIAGIIRGPHIFSPLRNLKGAIEQMNQTLDRMVDEKFISVEEKITIQSQKISLHSSKPPIRNVSYAARKIKSELDAILEGEIHNQSGMKVFTTLDHSWQKKLEKEAFEALRAIENPLSSSNQENLNQSPSSTAELQIATISLDNQTGGILAYIGGRNFENSSYDRTQSTRDLGAAFEPFISAAAAERGKFVLAGRPVQTGRQVGIQEVIRIATRCGIDGTFIETEDLFRGGAASSAQNLSTALATLVNHGNKNTPHIISHIMDEAGNCLYRYKNKPHKALSAAASKQALDTLEKGYGSIYSISNTASMQDCWLLRIGKSGSTVLWMGYDQPRALSNENVIHAEFKGILKGLAN